MYMYHSGVKGEYIANIDTDTDTDTDKDTDTDTDIELDLFSYGETGIRDLGN
jgi:hypothetical protein